MNDKLHNYCKLIKDRYNSGISTEHSYRADLQNLVQEILQGIKITNEPKRQKCGAPDYIIQKKDVPICYIEAKDIGADLDKIENTDQLERYKKSLDNLILTDYIQFRFFRYGEKQDTIKIAEIENGRIIPLAENFDSFINRLKNFGAFQGQTIKSAEKLAGMMAQKAVLMEEVIYKAVTEEDEDNSLKDQLKAFRQILIHDLEEKTFAEIYAQTIAYGLFAARLHDPVLETFSREEARGLIPRSNPFLRNLFDYVAGAQLDERVVWIVNDLADIFRATDLKTLLADFGKSTGQTDPFIHFYETFLGEYKPELRKKRGVYYTPEPVVNFIVRAVDDILKKEFDLSSGLADTTKITIKTEDEATGKPVKKEVHKVQILDPAAGTGTFLAEVVKQIHKNFQGQEGIWSDYVEEHLIPRLNGFEILMAPYTVCHLKLEMLLNQTGFKPKEENKQKRFRIFLTNSLEEAHPDTGTLFASWLSRESTEANYVKKDTPVMVILGNPPYSGISVNKGEWITSLIDNYKYIDGVFFNEKKHWLNDDYVKFIRFGQYFIDKNGEGILAYINNHSFLDNPTFRGMRWHLLSSFDKVYIINLHGNSLKKETCPDGSHDENVFDIQAGVSINIFVKNKKKKKGELAEVKYLELWGNRESKYKILSDNNLKSFDFKEVNYEKPFYFFMHKNYEGKGDYDKGFRIDELMPINVTGIVTMGDSFVISETKKGLMNILLDFFNNDYTEVVLKNKYGLGKNYAKWIIDNKKNIKYDEKNITKINYRPFDIRWTVFDNKLIWRWRQEVMRHFLKGENIGLIFEKIVPAKKPQYSDIFISKFIHDGHTIGSASYIAPLYLYQEQAGQIGDNPGIERKPNLNLEIIRQIAENLGLEFADEGAPSPDLSRQGRGEKEPSPRSGRGQGEGENSEEKKTFSPLDILDYIYAVLHSPNYREKYKEFLKIDFPRVPYPKDKKTFWKLVTLGGELRRIHLLEAPKVNQFITKYPVSGDNIVGKVHYENGKVFINETQYFENVPEIAWGFYIGGYQPAQKWLKDRKGRALNYDDIQHCQKIIVALTETNRIMKEIDG